MNQVPPAENGEVFIRLTRATRSADESFESSETGGGGTRHWLRDCFIPALENEGLCVLLAGDLADLERELTAAQGSRETYIREYEEQEARAEVSRKRIRELEDFVREVAGTADRVSVGANGLVGARIDKSAAPAVASDPETAAASTADRSSGASGTGDEPEARAAE